MVKLGALTDMFPRSVSLVTAFEEVGKAGYDGVEIGIGGSYWYHPIFNKEGRMKVIESAQSAKVEIASICAHFLWTFGFAHPDERIQDFSVDLVKDTIGIAREMEARIILLPAADTPLTDPHESLPLFKKNLLSCVESAEGNDIILAVEGVGREFMKDAQDLLVLVEEMDSKWIKAYFDIGNSSALGFDPAQEIHILGSHIAQVHVKDTSGKRLGQGRIDFESVIGALEDVGYDGYLVVELPPYRDDPYRTLYESIEFLTGLLGGTF